MSPRKISFWFPAAFLVLLAGCIGHPKAPLATARALDYLQKEVPSWKVENGCFSCHNNGDGARALFAAARAGYPVPESSLSDTLDWLAKPGQWDKNQGDPGFSDQRLANIQFGAALLSAVEAGRLLPASLAEAARRIASDQAPGGEWPIEPGSVGSPATYGTTLATCMAMKILMRAGSYPESVAKATAWLASRKPTNNSTVVSLLLAQQLGAATIVSREECVQFLREALTSDGGWGPYLDSPPEPFDTALALLALDTVRQEAGVEQLIRAGRAFLKRAQLSDGGWPGATRPAGGISYAQHISTTGWAALALLATDQ